MGKETTSIYDRHWFVHDGRCDWLIELCNLGSSPQVDTVIVTIIRPSSMHFLVDMCTVARHTICQPSSGQ